MKNKITLILLFKIWAIHVAFGQNLKADTFFTPSKTLNTKRLYGLVGVGAAGYTTAIFALNSVWYSGYARTKFHYFDDNGEWLQADKVGHALTAYNEAEWTYEAFRWAGVKNTNAALLGMASGMLFQTTFEMLDGYSSQWGFSWGDMKANLSGCVLFGVQQAAWREQRITFKVSNFPKNYSKTPVLVGTQTISISDMVKKLYGKNYTETFFKDYNAINWWLSVNPKSFAKNSKLPAWLNVAVGYSAENVFGAYYNLPPTNTEAFPRYRQYFLSLDIDLTRIKTKNKLLKTVFRAFNFVKIPAPALEYNSLKKFKFHPVMF